MHSFQLILSTSLVLLTGLRGIASLPIASIPSWVSPGGDVSLGFIEPESKYTMADLFGKEEQATCQEQCENSLKCMGFLYSTDSELCADKETCVGICGFFDQGNIPQVIPKDSNVTPLVGKLFFKTNGMVQCVPWEVPNRCGSGVDPTVIRGGGEDMVKITAAEPSLNDGIADYFDGQVFAYDKGNAPPCPLSSQQPCNCSRKLRKIIIVQEEISDCRDQQPCLTSVAYSTVTETLGSAPTSTPTDDNNRNSVTSTTFSETNKPSTSTPEQTSTPSVTATIQTNTKTFTTTAPTNDLSSDSSDDEKATKSVTEITMPTPWPNPNPGCPKATNKELLLATSYSGLSAERCRSPCLQGEECIFGKCQKVWRNQPFTTKRDLMKDFGLKNGIQNTQHLFIGVGPDMVRENVLVVRIPKYNGRVKGGSFFARPFPLKKYSSVTLAYDLYVSHDFIWAADGRLPGLEGGKGENCGSGHRFPNECFSSSVVWRSCGAGEGLVFTKSHLQRKDFCGASGATCLSTRHFAVGRGSFRLIPGKWMRIRQHVQLDTFSFKGKEKTSKKSYKDGIVELFVNNQLVSRVEGVAFRVKSDLKMEGIKFIVERGKFKGSYIKGREELLYFRNFVLAAH